MPVTFVEAFPDEDGAICRSFFSSTDTSEKTWAHTRLLAEADDVTFWTVVANHSTLHSVLRNLVMAVEHAHSSSSVSQSHAVKRQDEVHLGSIVVRLSSGTESCRKRNVDSADMAHRLQALLPLSVLFPAAVMLLRRSEVAASVATTSLMLLNPAYLCRISVYLSTWYEQVNRSATRCLSELQRGRFQRMSGDILQLFEHTYRGVKQLWCMLQCAPFLVDYIPLARTLRALRIVVDVISPLLQHFLLLCAELATRRDVLSRANSVIINASLNASSIMIFFHTYCGAGGIRTWLAPQAVRNASNAVSEYMRRYAQGVPQALLAHPKTGTIPHLLHQLHPPLEDGDDAFIGKVLLGLLDDIADSRDFSAVFSKSGTRQRYGQLVLMELVNQGVRIDDMLLHKLITSSEAQKLGASEDTIQRSLAGERVANTSSWAAGAIEGPAAGSPLPSADTALEEDPLVVMVKDIFPHFSAIGIRTALNFYNNDPEQLILDASMENLPPHLVHQLSASAAAASATASTENLFPTEEISLASHHVVSLITADFDDQVTSLDLQLFLGNDLYELVTGTDDDDDTATVYHDQVAYRKEEAPEAKYDAFNIEEDMKDRIRMLNEMMYEDELDDGAEELRIGGQGAGDTDSDDGYPCLPGVPSPANLQAESGLPQTANAAHRRRAHDDYDEKRFQVQRAKERTEHAKAKQSERNAPTYTQKAKTRKGEGISRNAVTRAYKKGKVDGW